MSDEPKLGIIGRERAQVDGLARLIHNVVKTKHGYSPIREDRRGSHFEVQIIDPDGALTAAVIRVTIEFDRIES